MLLNEFKDLLFKKAELEGFTEYEIYYADQKSFGVQVFEGELEKYTVSGNQSLSFRGIYNGQMGYAYTEILDEASVDFLIKSVKDNALIIEKEDKEIIYGGKDNYSNFNGYEESLSNVTPGEKIKLALAMEAEAKAQNDSVIRAESQIEDGESCCQIINSKGLNLAYKSNVVFAFVESVVKDEEGMNADYAFKGCKVFNELNARELSKEAVDNALAYKGAKSVKSGTYTAAIKNSAAASLLQRFSGIFSSDNTQKGLSLLKDKTGQCIASKLVTIMDNPLLKTGLNSKPFDDEGVAAYTKEVVKDGELKTLLYNLKTAAKDNVKSTGNASKASYSSPVEVAPSNFYFEPGEKSLEELLMTLGNGVFITELQGLHSGANPVSGDFSLAAKGFLVKDGIIERPVEQITVSGNFYKLLEDIIEVGSDLKFGFPSGSGYFGSPTLIVKEMSIAGE
jgi:PmbA protein